MEKIFVSIRVRPLSKVEATKGTPWKLGSNSIALCNSAGAPIPGQSYLFDKVFDSESSTLEIYETHTKDIIASAVSGFNGTVFAYGQTSSGKTYTMRGSPREPGIIPLAVQEIFKNIEAAVDREFLLRVSYMEIYNEEINDLLAPENRKLQVHENIERGIFVAGLREEIVVSPEQVLELMTAGETYRHVGETNMNVYSSRSHSIFRMVIESRDRSHDDPAGPASVQSCDAVRVSVLNLVDLAGSERIAKTGAEGARLKEGTHINKSLMTLGTVINKLSEGVEKQGGHIPYRDSKLTRILQPALGGNAKTAVICNITPAQIHVDETKGTLFFASRANRVTNCAQVNEIMTDAALLKRQKKEIEELRNKLLDNHSEHWDAEILNLRNALLKTELERERMALELQQEKAAQAERERRLKEQQRKIENLSSMVINAAVDDRDIDKRNKKNNRRETWCPRIPSIECSEQPQESKLPFPKESPLVKSMISTRREKLPPLPPPFESLMEDEDTVSPLLELNENTFGEEFQSLPSDGSNLDSIFQEPPPVLFCERKRRSSEKSMDDDLRKQLGDLQVQYNDLQLQNALKMQEKMLEMTELKEELAFTQSTVIKARKLENVTNEVRDKRGRSLDGWESDSNVQQLRVQIQNLELEKFYMQKELDTLKLQVSTEASSTLYNLKELQQELEEARNDAVSAKVDLSLALQKISDLQRDQELGMDQQAALAAHFNELTLEVETTKSSSQAFYKAAVDSTNALRVTLMNLQESVIDVKSLNAEYQHFGSLQSDLEALVKDHDSVLSVLQTVQKERDVFFEDSKVAQADRKSLEELRERNDEVEATASDLLAANKHIADMGVEIAELQSLLTQRESQLQVLEQNIKDLEDGAVGALSKAHKEKLEERIAELERDLELVSQEKARIICKGEALHVTIQVLEGERDALIETSKQAQADIDRVQGKRRQEIKEAQDKLETAFSESYRAKEQLLAMRSLLTEKTEEQQDLQFKLENLQREATTSTKVLEKSIQTLETQLAQESMKFETSRREYEELVATYEATNREKSEISEVCNRSEEELSRLCRELDFQVHALAETEKRLESGRVQCSEHERRLSELHLTLSEQNVELDSLRRKVANLSAEKCAMETCLAGHTPESIMSVLEEKSLQLSTAECSLQSSLAELEKVKHESTVLQGLRVTLEKELAEARAYSAAVEQSLSAAVSTLESTNQDKHIEEKERVIKEKEILLDATVQLQDRISYLEQEADHYEVELKQMEGRVASVTSELDDAGKQLNDVHSLLTENQKERLLLQRNLEELENHKDGLQKCLSIKDAELTSTSAGLTEVKTKFEAFQQQHNAESSQLRSDILGLRKELKTAKAAPGALEKERDGLRKDLEKLKSKLGDVEAKLKSTLIEKSKVETEKLNIEREVKQLRQSTALLNKRESIVDKRRESVACGLSKTKQQLSSTEHALQMKNNELEKTAFDLQLLQDNYTKLEADMLETENASVVLKNKLAEAESAISVLRDERGAATSTIEKISQKLEDELEQKRTSVAELDALRIQYTTMEEKLLLLQAASEKSEAEIKSISLLRDDLASQLTDAHFGFEEEKLAWASQEGLKYAKVEELEREIVNLTVELEKFQKAQEEIIAARNTLQEQLNEAEHTASNASVVHQEQVAKLEHSLQCKEQEGNQLRQQVELLSSNVEEQVELQRQLQEELFAGKEQYDALKDEFEKRKELLVVSEVLIQRERQSSVDLAEEVRQLNRMLQEAEKKCAELHDRNSDSEAAVRKESDERMQLLEERSALADRCIMLEGQISELQVSFKECSDNESRLLQEIQKLKEEHQNNMEVSPQKSEVSRHAIDLEAAWNTDRELARKQVEKLHSQLKMSHAEIESLQTELDDVGMKVKSLYLEVDDMQAALDQSRTEKAMLKQLLADLNARLSSLEDKNEQLQKKETHLLQVSKAYLLSRTKLQVVLDATAGRLEVVQSNYEILKEAIQGFEDDRKSDANKENDRLRVRIQNLRSRCQRYEEVLKELKSKRASPEDQQERESEIAEIMQQNSALQLRLQKSEENAKARREEMMKLHEVVQRKEETNSKLEAALQRVQAQMLKRERDLYQKSESQTARKFEGSTMPSLEFTTPTASRHGQDDSNHADNANGLHSSTFASRSKVEQLKLQSQSLLRMYKQPWRFQGSPIGRMDDTGDHPPPSATLDSHRENLTAPIPTWKRAMTAGASSKTESLQPCNSVFSEDRLQASAFDTRSVPRAALVPVNTQNKLQEFGLKRRLQESGPQDTLPAQGIDEVGTKPAVSSLQMPRNVRFRQRFEKENM